MISRSGPGLRLEIESRLSRLPLASAIVTAFCQELGIDEENRFAVDLCVTEAITNSIKHAYLGEPDHSVVLLLDRSDQGIEIRIEDEGIPIDPSTCERHLAEHPDGADLLTTGGRGLYLISQIMDTVVFTSNRNEVGNVVRLSLAIPSDRTRLPSAPTLDTGSEAKSEKDESC